MTTLYDVTNSFPAQKTSENVMFITIMLIYINHELPQINILSEFKKMMMSSAPEHTIYKKVQKSHMTTLYDVTNSFPAQKPLKMSCSSP